MDKKNCHAYNGLKRINEVLDVEFLVSRSGVGEPDSNFIWASTFMAPESLVVLDGQMFLNLFLPEGSENDPEKKFFLNRVGARLQDGLWQVRRRMDQLKGQYGAPAQFTLSTFKTAIIDQVYIKNGRNYAHLLMNRSDVEVYSRLMLRVQKEMPDIRVEYFRKFGTESCAYLIPGLEEDLLFVTLEFGYEDSPLPTGKDEGEFFFTLANFVEGGVKAIARTRTGVIPEIMAPDEISTPAENVYAFKSNNRFILSLFRAIANQYVVIFGSYGSISPGKATLTVAMPKQQVQTFMRILANVADEVNDCTPNITEVMSIGDFQ